MSQAAASPANSPLNLQSRLPVFSALAYIGVFVAVIFSQIYRYRRVSNAVQRQQIKWAVFGIVLSFVLLSGEFVLSIVVGLLDPNPQGPLVFLGIASDSFWLLAFLPIPIFIGLAITRSRLWDIDAIINKALVYGLLTGLLAAVYAGLMAAARFASDFGETEHAATYTQAAQEIQAATRQYLWHEGEGRFLRRIVVLPNGSIEPDLTLDASITGLYQFGMFDAGSDEIRRTMEAIEARLVLKSAVGGAARYENDYYHQVSHDLANVPGNPWFICACWLAEYHIARATTLEELHQALGWLEWVRAHALPSGVLAEQVDPYSGAPLSVSPLTWSHAEYVAAVRWYAGKHRRLTGQDAPHAHEPQH